jgi:hypothetical protein
VQDCERLQNDATPPAEPPGHDAVQFAAMLTAAHSRRYGNFAAVKKKTIIRVKDNDSTQTLIHVCCRICRHRSWTNTVKKTTPKKPDRPSPDMQNSPPPLGTSRISFAYAMRSTLLRTVCFVITTR